MFTGIVAAVGNIRRVEPLGDDGVRLSVDAGSLGMDDVAIGDSIAIQGACMTVVSMTPDSFTVDVSAESLRRTVGLAQPGPVNLEKAMRLSDRLGGHLVSGHVDGLGVVRQYRPVGESHLLEILAPWSMAAFLVYKGSITVNGVSLTVNGVQDLALADALDAGWGADAAAVLRDTSVAAHPADRCCAFQINLIPHTVAVTTLQHVKPGDRVNLEVDMVARYLARRNEVERIDASLEQKVV
ncbi:MAG: riboflavin synthase [Lautropia sp.]|nr:riboflavin synthase [Lautropia sp.]